MSDLIEWNGSKDAFDRAFSQVIEREEGKTSIPSDEWRASGRATAKWPDREGREWWEANGPVHLDAYVRWRQENGDRHQIWIAPDGTPGVELDATVRFGRVKVRAIIDRVFIVRGLLVVVDLKTGARVSSSLLQLGVYASVVQLKYGIRPALGTFFSTRKGGVTGFTSLHPYSVERLTLMFETIQARATAGPYLPAPGDHCSWCDVGAACAINNGPKAPDHDSLSLL